MDVNCYYAKSRCKSSSDRNYAVVCQDHPDATHKDNNMNSSAMPPLAESFFD